MSIESYARSVYYNREYCQLIPGVVSLVAGRGVSVTYDNNGLISDMNVFTWPEQDYYIGQQVVVVIPPDDVAIALPMGRQRDLFAGLLTA
jgi:hypothetical protein